MPLPYQGDIPPPIGTPLIKGGRGDRTENLFSPLLTDQVTLNRSLIQADNVPETGYFLFLLITIFRVSPDLKPNLSPTFLTLGKAGRWLDI